MAEIRTLRVEDWLGNRYLFQAGGGEGVGGSTSGGGVSSEEIGDPSSGLDNITEGTISSDPGSNGGKVIIAQSSTAKEVIVARLMFDNLAFGSWSVVSRIKSNAIGTDEVIATINTYYVDRSNTHPIQLLSTLDVTKNMFASLTNFTEIGFVVDFKGNYSSTMGLRVDIILKQNVNTSLLFDSVFINKAHVPLVGANATNI